MKSKEKGTYMTDSINLHDPMICEMKSSNMKRVGYCLFMLIGACLWMGAIRFGFGIETINDGSQKIFGLI